MKLMTYLFGLFRDYLSTVTATTTSITISTTRTTNTTEVTRGFALSEVHHSLQIG